MRFQTFIRSTNPLRQLGIVAAHMCCTVFCFTCRDPCQGAIHARIDRRRFSRVASDYPTAPKAKIKLLFAALAA